VDYAHAPKNNKSFLPCSPRAVANSRPPTLLRFGQTRGRTPGFFGRPAHRDQKLKAHFHLRCRVAGGVVADNGQRWIASGNYLFNQIRTVAGLPRQVMQLLHRAWQTQKLHMRPSVESNPGSTPCGQKLGVRVRTRQNSRHRFLIIWPAIPPSISPRPCCHRGQMLLVFEIPNYWSRAPIRRLLAPVI